MYHILYFIFSNCLHYRERVDEFHFILWSIIKVTVLKEVLVLLLVLLVLNIYVTSYETVLFLLLLCISCMN
jgi:hypothetical protein